jgi:transporter family protein
LEAFRVAPIDKLRVVFAIKLGVVFLHEQVAWQQWVGGLLIVGGAALLAWF